MKASGASSVCHVFASPTPLQDGMFFSGSFLYLFFTTGCEAFRAVLIALLAPLGGCSLWVISVVTANDPTALSLSPRTLGLRVSDKGIRCHGIGLGSYGKLRPTRSPLLPGESRFTFLPFYASRQCEDVSKSQHAVLAALPAPWVSTSQMNPTRAQGPTGFSVLNIRR